MSILPDYGLEDLAGDEFADDDLDTFNDDTFGGAGEWEHGNEGSLESMRLHEDFLSGTLGSLPPLGKEMMLQAEPGMLDGAVAKVAGDPEELIHLAVRDEVLNTRRLEQVCSHPAKPMLSRNSSRHIACIGVSCETSGMP